LAVRKGQGEVRMCQGRSEEARIRWVGQGRSKGGQGSSGEVIWKVIGGQGKSRQDERKG
jgi:hypothetical protein